MSANLGLKLALYKPNFDILFPVSSSITPFIFISFQSLLSDPKLVLYLFGPKMAFQEDSCVSEIFSGIYAFRVSSYIFYVQLYSQSITVNFCSKFRVEDQPTRRLLEATTHSLKSELLDGKVKPLMALLTRMKSLFG